MTQLWRLVRTGIFNAYENMAIDHVLLEALHKETAANTIRFYRWNPSAVSIGRFQHLDYEVDVDACHTLNIDIVRRISSGGAVFHDEELTYSIVIPESHSQIPKNIMESYGRICEAIIKGLKCPITN